MDTGDRGRARDPRSIVEAPVIGALNGIVLRAVIGFSVVAAFATVPLIVRMDRPVHEAFHLALPLGSLAFAALTGLIYVLRPPPAEPDVWSRASEIDPALVHFARRVSTFMLVGWLASVGAVLVHHHLGSPRQVLATVIVDVPLTLAFWLLAVVAWTSWCRASLARAEHAAAERLRRYWRQLPPSREHPDGPPRTTG